MRFCPLLHGFLSKSHDLSCYIKPRRYSLFYISIKTQDYVISPYQVHLSKTTKHWDGFVSHCNSPFTFERSASYVNFLARRTASPVLPHPLAALPALWTKDEMLEESFHCTTVKMSGMLQPCFTTSV